MRSCKFLAILGAILSTAFLCLWAFDARCETITKTIAINKDASLYERAQALRAVNELTALGYPTRIVEANENPDASLFFIQDSFGKFKPQTDLGQTIMGSISFVFVDRIKSGNYDLCGTIMHEVGHSAWKLPHANRGFMSTEAGPDSRCKQERKP